MQVSARYGQLIKNYGYITEFFAQIWLYRAKLFNVIAKYMYSNTKTKINNNGSEFHARLRRDQKSCIYASLATEILANQ